MAAMMLFRWAAATLLALILFWVGAEACIYAMRVFFPPQPRYNVTPLVVPKYHKIVLDN